MKFWVIPLAREILTLGAGGKPPLLNTAVKDLA
jgi:hypothetical protein